MSAAAPARPGAGLARAGAVLAAAQAVAGGAAYLLNTLLARWLDPHGFADASLLVGLFLVASAPALVVQLVTARAVARSGDEAPVRRLHRTGWLVGLAVAAVLAAGAPAWADLLRTQDAAMLVVLAAGMPFYLALAAGRGVLQGRERFAPLAATYVVEAVVRLGVGALAVAAGSGATGAAAALAVSCAVSWASARALCGPLPAGRASLAGLGPTTLGAGVLLLGQVLANNADLLVAKHHLDPETAARYAAVSLVGRGVFFVAWSLAMATFPAAARDAGPAGPRDMRNTRNTRNMRDMRDMRDTVLPRALLAVTALGATAAVVCAVAGDRLLEVAFGPHYTGLSTALAVHALVTTGLALACVTASHRLATGRLDLPVLVALGAVAEVLALLALHDSVRELLTAQALSTGGLLAGVLLVQRSRDRAAAPAGAVPAQGVA